MSDAWTDADWTAFQREIEARWYKGEVRTPEQWQALRAAVTTRDPEYVALALDHLHLRIDAVPSAARIVQTADELRDHAVAESQRKEQEAREKAERAMPANTRRTFGSIEQWLDGGAPGLDAFVQTALNPPPAHLTDPLDLAAWPNCLVAPPDWPLGEWCPPDQRVPMTAAAARNVMLMIREGKTRTRLGPRRDTEPELPPEAPPEAVHSQRRTVPPPTKPAPWSRGA